MSDKALLVMEPKGIAVTTSQVTGSPITIADEDGSLETKDDVRLTDSHTGKEIKLDTYKLEKAHSKLAKICTRANDIIHYIMSNEKRRQFAQAEGRLEYARIITVPEETVDDKAKELQGIGGIITSCVQFLRLKDQLLKCTRLSIQVKQDSKFGGDMTIVVSTYYNLALTKSLFHYFDNHISKHIYLPKEQDNEQDNLIPLTQ